MVSLTRVKWHTLYPDIVNLHLRLNELNCIVYNGEVVMLDKYRDECCAPARFSASATLPSRIDKTRITSICHLRELSVKPRDYIGIELRY